MNVFANAWTSSDWKELITVVCAVVTPIIVLILNSKTKSRADELAANLALKDAELKAQLAIKDAELKEKLATLSHTSEAAKAAAQQATKYASQAKTAVHESKIERSSQMENVLQEIKQSKEIASETKEIASEALKSANGTNEKILDNTIQIRVLQENQTPPK